jgi:hypothetical protein
LIWFKKGISGGFLWTRWCTLGALNM